VVEAVMQIEGPLVNGGVNASNPDSASSAPEWAPSPW
jgi:hypothetical protein